MKLALVVIAIAILGTCGSTCGGPFMPAGAHRVDYRLVSSMGPVADQEYILATTSLASSRTEVLQAPHKYPPGPLKCTRYGIPAGVCWADVADRADVLYIATLIFPDCSTNVADDLAEDGRTLFFVHWVGLAPFEQRGGCALGAPAYTLYTVSRSQLPARGVLTVKLVIQDAISGDSIPAQTTVDLG